MLVKINLIADKQPTLGCSPPCPSTIAAEVESLPPRIAQSKRDVTLQLEHFRPFGKRAKKVN